MNWILCFASLLPLALQDSAPQAPRTGVLQRSEQAVPGYTLIAPLRSTETLLIDDRGAVVHRWKSEFTPGNAAELLPNGNLLRAAKVGGNDHFQGGGEGGLLEEFTWEGERVWTYDLSSDEFLHHHDFEVLPNGNVLVLVWEGKSREAALAAGRRPDSLDEAGLWPDAIWELRPLRPEGAEIVWSWHAWDHLVQDFDASLPNHGDPRAHPQRIDINIGAAKLEQPETEEEREARLELEQRLRALGYLGDEESEDETDAAPADAGRGRSRSGADWMHTNAVDYDAELDLIVISARNFNEVFVIDHSTTTEQAAGSEGGAHGRGGDLLWRWGNPANYGHAAAQKLFGQHDARWTREDGRVAMSVFNNGEGRPDGDYSSVDLLHLPFTDEGRFAAHGASPAQPEGIFWSYSDPIQSEFFSSHISGAMPLSDGRFLVCEGSDGRVFQVDRSGTLLWEFLSPFQGEAGSGGPPGEGPRSRPGGGPPPRGEPGEGRPEGGPGGRPERGPGDRPPGGRGDRGPGGGRHGGSGPSNSIFRAVHIPLDHPGLPAALRSGVSESSD